MTEPSQNGGSVALVLHVEAESAVRRAHDDAEASIRDVAILGERKLTEEQFRSLTREVDRRAKELRRMILQLSRHTDRQFLQNEKEVAKALVVLTANKADANEWRGTLKDIVATLPTKEVLDRITEGIFKRLVDLERFKDTTQGGAAWIKWSIGFVLTVVGLGLGLLLRGG